MTKPMNWTEIANTCPEFIYNALDVILAIIAIVGLILNLILYVRFQKQRKEGSSYLGMLTGYDIVVCLMYLWRYSATSLIVGLQSDTLAQLHLDFRPDAEYFLKIFGQTMTFVMLFIFVERFLWTCSSRTRYTWRVFILKMPKFILIVVTIVFVIVSAILTPVHNEPFSNVPFCDIVFPLLTFDDEFFHIVQKSFFSIMILTSILTLIFAVLSAFRLKHVGEGNEPINQEEVNLENQTEENRKLSPHAIKRSIICMLVIYIMILMRAVAYYGFIEHYTSNFYSLDLHNRILTLWRYDFFNVVLSSSRFVVYFAICKDHIVTEYPPNMLGQS